MQGFNMGRYVPPDVEGTTTGNRLHGKRPPSTPTVRFEMPFAVWCARCPKPTLIGQGVRFNAEKRRVGAYHSTPIFAFRMRHADCGGALEIRTDPQNTTYVVTEGGRRRDYGDGDGDQEKAVEPILTGKERDELRGSAFAKLERTIEDRRRLEEARDRIGALEAASARAWDDPYEQNRRLRRGFRAGRHDRERAARDDDDLRARLGLGDDFALAPADNAADARRAALVDFRPLAAAVGDGGAPTADKVLARPLFESPGAVPKKQPTPTPPGTNLNSPRTRTKRERKGQGHKNKKPLLKSELAASKTRETLVSEILGNTRAARDPFLVSRGSGSGSGSGSGGPGGAAAADARAATSKIVGIKRKRPPGGEQEQEQGGGGGEEQQQRSRPLLAGGGGGEKEPGEGPAPPAAPVGKGDRDTGGVMMTAAPISAAPATATLVEYDSDSA